MGDDGAKSQTAKQPEKPKKVEDVKEQQLAPEKAKPTAVERAGVFLNLKTKTEYTQVKPTSEDTINNLAKKLYLVGKDVVSAHDLILESLGSKASPEEWTKLQEAGCKFIRVENGWLRFYKTNDFKPENQINESDIEITDREEASKPVKKDAATEKAEENEATLNKFKEWFPGKEVTKGNATANLGKYVFNTIPGKAVWVYNETTGNQRSDNTFEYTENPVVTVESGMTVDVAGIKYVKISEVEVSHDGKKTTKKENVWVRLIDLFNQKAPGSNEITGIETKSEWGNPDKKNNTAKVSGEIDRAGPHLIKKTTDFYSYEGSKRPAVPANESVNVIENKIYQINNEPYLRVIYKHSEGWIKAEDVFTTEKIRVEKTAEQKSEESHDEAVKAKRTQVEENNALKFADKTAEQKTKLTDIYDHAEDGDTIEITAKGAKTAKIATFRNGDFFYQDNKRVIILNGYKLGEYKKAPRLKGNEKASEKINSIGSIVLKSEEYREGLKTYLDIAKTVLDSKNSADELSKLGFAISNPNLLDQLRKNNPNPYEYAELLKQHQVGDKVFLILVTKTAETRQTDIADKMAGLRQDIKSKRSERDNNMIKSKAPYLEQKELFNLDKKIVEWAKDGGQWNRAWEEKDRFIVGNKTHLRNLWTEFFPQRSDSELRDLIRKFIVESEDKGILSLGSRTGVNVALFFKIFNIYRKTDGTTGTLDEFTKEYQNVEAEFKKLDPTVIKSLDNDSGEKNYARITEKMAMNRKKYGPNATTQELLEDIPKQDQDFMINFAIGNTRKTIRRYLDLTGIRNGSILMLSAMADLKPYTIESDPNAGLERDLTNGEKRVDEIFYRHDTGDKTMSDIAGDKGKEGQNTEFRLLSWTKGIPGLEILSTNWIKNAPKFNQKSTGESAFVATLEKCRDEHGNVDNTKLVDQLNFLLSAGVYGSHTEDTDLKPDELYKQFSIDPKDLKNRNDQLFAKLKFSPADLTKPMDDKSNVGKYRKLLVQIGYLIDSSASEGKVETPETAQQPKLTIEVIEKFSDDAMIRAIQIKAVKKGYPVAEVNQIPSKIQDAVSKHGPGAVVDLGGDGRKPGGGVGVPIDIGHGVYIGLGAGNIDGRWQGALAVGTQVEINEYLSAGVSLGTNLPLSGKPAPSLAGGFEVTIPLGGSSWELFIAPGASLNLLQLITEGANVGAGVMIGGKWNAKKGLEKETKEQLKKYQLEKIEEAIKYNDRQKAVELINQHPTLGKLSTLMTLSYGWSDDDVLKMYQEQKKNIENAAVENLNPVITRLGVGGGVGVGPGNAPGLYLGAVIAFNIGKTVTVYQTESRGTTAMTKQGEEAIAQQVIEKFGNDKELNFSAIQVLKEKSRTIYGVDGKPVIAVDANEKAFNFREIMGTKGLAELNEQLKGAGITLREGTGDEKGLIQIVISAIDHQDDPTYNKRTTAVYIDPALGQNPPSKGLILRDGKIFLAAGANPDLLLTRLNYNTPFRDQDNATAHSVFMIMSGIPRSPEELQKVQEDIRRNSGTFLYKSPDHALTIRQSEKPEDIKQWNIQEWEVYQKSKNYFEQYDEAANRKLYEEYGKAAARRTDTFEKINDVEKPRTGLVADEDDKDLTTDCFAKRFYEKKGVSTEFKKLSTGANPDIGTLFKKMDTEWAKDTAGKNQPPLTLLEKNRIILNLTRRSWASIENAKDKEKKFKERLDWATRVLLPIWDDKIKKINAANPNNQIKGNAKDLLAHVISKLRDTNFNNEPDNLPEGSLSLTLAGTEKIEGFRANNGAKALLRLDQYSSHLGESNKNGEVARIILETLSPLPDDKADFMQSPLALKVLSKRALVIAWGVEDFNRMTQNYEALKKGGKEGLSDALEDSRNMKAFNRFEKLVKDIRAAEMDKTGGNLLQLENGCYIKLKPTNIVSGVDKTCANFSISVNEDFDVEVPRDQSMALAAVAGVHSTVSAKERATIIQAGLGGVGKVKTEDTPPPPPTPQQPKGGGSSEGGGGGGHKRRPHQGGGEGSGGGQKPPDGGGQKPPETPVTPPPTSNRGPGVGQNTGNNEGGTTTGSGVTGGNGTKPPGSGGE